MTPPSLPDNAALFLDFDGTLVEIAARPDAILVPEPLPGLLQRLHRHLGGALALISGRGIDDLRHYLPDFPGVIVGGHGAEIWPHSHADLLPSIATEDVARAQSALIEKAKDNPAWLYEAKTHGGVLHYRSEPSLEAQAISFAEDLVARCSGLAIQRAKMAVEIRPEGVAKDQALVALMASAPFLNRRPVFAGDDTTDEPALAAAVKLGGIAIKIGHGDSQAPYRLQDPAALADWLSATIL